MNKYCKELASSKASTKDLTIDSESDGNSQIKLSKNGWKFAVRIGYFCGLFISGCLSTYLPLLLKFQGIEKSKIGWIFCFGSLAKMCGPLSGNFVNSRGYLSFKSLLLLCSLVSLTVQVAPLSFYMTTWKVSFSCPGEAMDNFLNKSLSKKTNMNESDIKFYTSNSTNGTLNIVLESMTTKNDSSIAIEVNTNDTFMVLKTFWITIICISIANLLEYLIQATLDGFICQIMFNHSPKHDKTDSNNSDMSDRYLNNPLEIRPNCLSFVYSKINRSTNNATEKRKVRPQFGKFRMYGPFGYGLSIFITIMVPFIYQFHCKTHYVAPWVYNIVLLFVTIIGQSIFFLAISLKLKIDSVKQYTLISKRYRSNFGSLKNKIDESNALIFKENTKPLVEEKKKNSTNSSLKNHNNFFYIILTNRILIMDLLIHCLYCTSLSIGFVFMAILVSENKLSNSIIGVAALIGCLADIVGMYVSSFFERYLDKWWLIFSLCLIFHIIRSFLVGFCPSYWSIFIYSSFSVLTYGIYRPMIVFRISNLSQKDHLSTCISLITTFGCIGFSLGSVIGGYSIGYIGFKNTFYSSALLSLVLIIINAVRIFLTERNATVTFPNK